MLTPRTSGPNVPKGFKPVKCQVCSKVYCYAAPGSSISFKCKDNRCKTIQVVKI